jgi:hypothetical protein
VCIFLKEVSTQALPIYHWAMSFLFLSLSCEFSLYIFLISDPLPCFNSNLNRHIRTEIKGLKCFFFFPKSYSQLVPELGFILQICRHVLYEMHQTPMIFLYLYAFDLCDYFENIQLSFSKIFLNKIWISF